MTLTKINKYHTIYFIITRERKGKEKMDLEEVNLMMERKNLVGVKLNLDSFAYSFYKDIIERYEKKELTERDMDTLEVVLQGLDFLYISGEVSPLRDTEYDALHVIYNEKTGKFITNKAEAGKSKKVKHIYPQLKGTLKKVHYVADNDKKANAIKTHISLERWIRGCLEKLPYGRSYELSFYFKFDGISVVFALRDGKVYSAITRGDADTGEGKDVTHNFKDLTFSGWAPGVGMPSEIGVKTEVVMPRKEFEKYSKKYRSDTRKLEDPRSAASGLVNADVLPKDMLQYLNIVELEYFINGKFVFPDTYLGEHRVKKIRVDKDFDMELIRKVISSMKEEIDSYGINCDGVVVRFTEDDVIKTLGRDEEKSINRFEIAFKFPPEEKETTLENVEFQIGLLGTVSPVAKIAKVKMKGKTIKSISLGSIDRLKTMKLRLGDDVLIKYEIIPYIDKVRETEGNTNPVIEPIDTCPYCGRLLEEKPVLMCVNNECPSRIMGKINNFCVKMDIKNIGGSTIETLFNAGILRSIEDLYRLKERKSAIIELDGFGEKKFETMYKSIKKQSEVDASTLLGSLGIKSIGRKMFKKILNIYYFDVLMGYDVKDIDKLTQIPGIKDATASKVIGGLKENKETIEFLLKNVKLIKKKDSEYNIVFTEVRNGEFEKHLESLGYEISDSVNKKTKFVITKEPDTVTGKTKRADELGIKKLDILSAYKEFNF